MGWARRTSCAHPHAELGGNVHDLMNSTASFGIKLGYPCELMAMCDRTGGEVRFSFAVGGVLLSEPIALSSAAAEYLRAETLHGVACIHFGEPFHITAGRNRSTLQREDHSRASNNLTAQATAPPPPCAPPPTPKSPLPHPPTHPPPPPPRRFLPHAIHRQSRPCSVRAAALRGWGCTAHRGHGNVQGEEHGLTYG